jgi:hypothetical protein
VVRLLEDGDTFRVGELHDGWVRVLPHKFDRRAKLRPGGWTVFDPTALPKGARLLPYQ